MKKLVLIILVLGVSACSQQAGENAPTATLPEETAAEFVARINDELAELTREIGAADWVRSTYITEDTAILAARSEEHTSELQSH